MAYKYVTYENLTRYDGKIKDYIATEDAKSYKTIAVDAVAKKVYFYKKENAVAGTDTPDAVVDIAYIPLIESAVGGKVAMTTANGTITEGDLSLENVASTGYVDERINSVTTELHSAIDSVEAELTSSIDSLTSSVASLTDYVGEIPSTAGVNTVTSYIEKVEQSIANLDADIDIVEPPTGNQLKLYNIIERDGLVSRGSEYTQLASVALTGAASDVSLNTAYTDIEGSTYSNVEDAVGAINSDITELASQSAGGVASKTVWFRDASAGQSEYAKVYKLYQGANAPESETEPAALIGTINTPKDKALQDAKIVTITFDDGKLYDGLNDVTALIKEAGETATAADAGKYIKFIMQNVADPLYANLSEFIDIYRPQENASQVQIVIDNNNVISATIVAGSITATELSADAVTTVKILDENVTKAKLSSTVQASLDLADSALQSADFEAITNAEIDALFA